MVTTSVREHLLRSGDALVLVDPTGAATYATPRALALLGADSVGTVSLDLVEQAGLHGPLDLRTPAGDVAARRVEQVRAPDGSELDVVALSTDTDALAVFLAPTATHPAPAEAPARTAISMLEKVLESTRDAVLVTTAEPFGSPGPVIVYANEALAHHTGWSVDELLGRSPRILQGEGTDREVLAAFAAEIEQWRPATIEVINYRKDGSEFWVELDVVPMADETGWFTHWVSVQRDVTRRHEEAERQRAELETVQTILDSLPSETVMLDGDGRIVAVNGPWREAWAMGTGEPQPRWIGMDYLEATAPTTARTPDVDGVAVRRGIESVLSGELTSYSLDYECRVRDDLRWFHVHVVPISGRAGVVVTHTDITARKRAEDELSHQARHDALTGLPNRELLRERLQIELSRSRARGSLTAVAFIDLDNFKDINDAYGHVYGDLVLDAVGERLEQAVRREDTVARIGGDEYVVLLSDLEHDFDPEPYFSRVRDAVSQPVELGVAEVRPSMSIGLVLSPPHLGDVDAVLRDADTAMYAAKRAGRDRWELFTPAVRDEAIGRALTTDRLATALQEDGFVLHYQPVVHLASSRVLGAEALLRLRAPDGSLLYPGQFLAAVDSGPLAADVGAWVLDHALRQQAIWQKVDPAHIVGINVSPRQLGHGRFVDEVRHGLERHGVHPDHLMLELTEDVLVSATSRAEDEIAALRALGLRFSIDDFGTGYSSLSYLNRLPADALKIDRSFLLEAQKPGGKALMAAIVGVARAVGAETVAEGVETLEQLALVRAMGVDLAQGFLLGRPEEPLDVPRASLVDTAALRP